MKNTAARLTSFLPLLLSFAITLCVVVETGRRPTPADAEPFHAAAAAAILSIPTSFGQWEGVDVPVPAAAQTLLKPNALLARAYRNKDTGQRASLVLVQCKDTRDMAGHYPPICYPGQGWVEDGPRQETVIYVGARPVTAVRYDFRREAFDRDRRLVVYNFFAIPGKGLPIDMKLVRAAAADYAARPFGAAQVQVVFEDRRSIEDEQAVVAALLLPLEPVVELLSDGKWRTR